MLKKFGGKEKRRIFAVPIEKRVFERTRVLRKTVRVSDDLHRNFERNFKKTEKSFADSKIKLTFATPFEKRVFDFF